MYLLIDIKIVLWYKARHQVLKCRSPASMLAPAVTVVILVPCFLSLDDVMVMELKMQNRDGVSVTTARLQS